MSCAGDMISGHLSNILLLPEYIACEEIDTFQLDDMIFRNLYTTSILHVCMVVTYSKSKDQPCKVANPARGQLKREN